MKAIAKWVTDTGDVLYLYHIGARANNEIGTATVGYPNEGTFDVTFNWNWLEEGYEPYFTFDGTDYLINEAVLVH